MFMIFLHLVPFYSNTRHDSPFAFVQGFNNVIGAVEEEDGRTLISLSRHFFVQGFNWIKDFSFFKKSKIGMVEEEDRRNNP